MEGNRVHSKDDEDYSATLKSSSNNSYRGILINNSFKTWTEISRINYKSSMFLDAFRSNINGKDNGKSTATLYNLNKKPPEVKPVCKNEEESLIERFPIHVTNLMNEDQLWGCFYTFPELYMDEYSPVEQILKPGDVAELVGGVLTRDMVAACLTYLKRTPILGDYVYIKLNLSSKLLVDIQVLEHYKYLVFLDLSYNLLTSLNVLSQLLYLQYLTVDYNRLTTVLEYDTPQWFLTEVHYKFNSVKKIRNLVDFWSVTVLDLSHNNITCINGLEELHFLRRLDLSFNHIQKLESLNRLKLTWLDVSYNNISCFEISDETGLWTLLHLEYLNLNENQLTSFKLLAGCTRLQELHLKNNRFSSLLELAVYARQLSRITILDLRANPVTEFPGYQEVILNTFPRLTALDAEHLDPIHYGNLKMSWEPDVTTFATQRLQRLLYVEQLSKSRVFPHTPPADTTELPIVVLVGIEAIGKGSLSRRLATECGSHVELARQHTTANNQNPENYIEVSRKTFDDMIVNGELLTYSESGGESYGLSRKEAFVTDGMVKIVVMDLIGALMLRLRGRRPYLILVTCSNKQDVFVRQCSRAKKSVEGLASYDFRDRSALQVLLSGRIIITGILNEIFMSLTEDKEKSEFIIPSKCSLLYKNSAQRTSSETDRNIPMEYTSSTDSTEQFKSDKGEVSIYSIYKESNTGINVSVEPSCQDQSILKKYKSTQIKKISKSVDFNRFTSSSGKGTIGTNEVSTLPGSMKSFKSVAFIQETESTRTSAKPDASKMVEPTTKEPMPKSISANLHYRLKSAGVASTLQIPNQEDIWMDFLMQAGILQTSDSVLPISSIYFNKTLPSYAYSMMQFDEVVHFREEMESKKTSIRDDYDNIHRKSPGLFWNVISLDDPDEAYLKLKRILHELVDEQKNLSPMFDIDFTNLPYYPTVEKKLMNIRQQIAPQQLFH